MLQVLLKMVDQEDQVVEVELLILLILQEQQDRAMKEAFLYQKEVRVAQELLLLLLTQL